MLNSFANIFGANEVIGSEFLKPLICNCLLMCTCQGYTRSSHQTNLPGIYPLYVSMLLALHLLSPEELGN